MACVGQSQFLTMGQSLPDCPGTICPVAPPGFTGSVLRTNPCELTQFCREISLAFIVYHQERCEMMDAERPPLPPFSAVETAAEKVRLAEDAWNTREPERVAQAYTIDSHWRNRVEFFQGRAAIVAFLTRKWHRELDYRLIKELWAFHGNRIAVRFAYEWHDDSGTWFRSYGNELWEFDERGLMRRRVASINDAPIRESDRKYHWPLGRRPDDHPSLSDLGL